MAELDDLLPSARFVPPSLRVALRQVDPRRFVLTVFLTTLAYGATAMLIGHPPSHYFKEGRVLTLFSSFMMSLTAALCLLMYYLRKPFEEKRRTRRLSRRAIWLLMAAGFAFLAVDEVACLHEKAGHFLATIFTHRLLTNRLDGILVLLLAPIGLTCLYFSRREMLRFRHHWPLFALGVSLFLSMVFLDILCDDDRLLKIVMDNVALRDLVMLVVAYLEDIAKLVGVSSFLGLFLGIAQDLTWPR